MAKLSDKITLTLAELKSIFIAGEDFERDTINVETDEAEKVTEPDFGDYMFEVHGIKLD